MQVTLNHGLLQLDKLLEYLVTAQVYIVRLMIIVHGPIVNMCKIHEFKTIADYEL